MTLSAEDRSTMLAQVRELLSQSIAMEQTLALHNANIVLAKAKAMTLSEDARSVTAQLTDIEEKVHTSMHSLVSMKTAILLIVDELDKKVPV